MPIALTQEPQQFETTPPDDTFHDLVDVVGVAVPLAFAVLLLAVSWPNVKRWVRHRLRRRRRRHRHGAHPDLPAGHPNEHLVAAPPASHAADTPR